MVPLQRLSGLKELRNPLDSSSYLISVKTPNDPNTLCVSICEEDKEEPRASIPVPACTAMHLLYPTNPIIYKPSKLSNHEVCPSRDPNDEISLKLPNNGISALYIKNVSCRTDYYHNLFVSSRDNRDYLNILSFCVNDDWNPIHENCMKQFHFTPTPFDQNFTRMSTSIPTSSKCLLETQGSFDPSPLLRKLNVSARESAGLTSETEESTLRVASPNTPTPSDHQLTKMSTSIELSSECLLETQGPVPMPLLHKINISETSVFGLTTNTESMSFSDKLNIPPKLVVDSTIDYLMHFDDNMYDFDCRVFGLDPHDMEYTSVSLKALGLDSQSVAMNEKKVKIKRKRETLAEKIRKDDVDNRKTQYFTPQLPEVKEKRQYVEESRQIYLGFGARDIPSSVLITCSEGVFIKPSEVIQQKSKLNPKATAFRPTTEMLNCIPTYKARANVTAREICEQVSEEKFDRSLPKGNKKRIDSFKKIQKDKRDHCIKDFYYCMEEIKYASKSRKKIEPQGRSRVLYIRQNLKFEQSDWHHVMTFIRDNKTKKTKFIDFCMAIRSEETLEGFFDKYEVEPITKRSLRALVLDRVSHSVFLDQLNLIVVMPQSSVDMTLAVLFGAVMTAMILLASGYACYLTYSEITTKANITLDSMNNLFSDESFIPGFKSLTNQLNTMMVRMRKLCDIPDSSLVHYMALISPSTYGWLHLASGVPTPLELASLLSVLVHLPLGRSLSEMTSFFYNLIYEFVVNKDDEEFRGLDREEPVRERIIDPQGFMSMFDGVKIDTDKLKGKLALAMSVMCLVVLGRAVPILKPLIKNITAGIMTMNLPKMKFMDVLSNAISTIMLKVDKFSTTKDWKVLFCLTDEELLLENLEEAIHRMDNCSSNKYTVDQIKLFNSEVVFCVMQNPAYHKALNSTINLFFAKKSRWENGLSSTRTPPTSFFVYGDSGVGKTTMVELLSACIKQQLGIPKEVNVTQDIDIALKHQTIVPYNLLTVINDGLSMKDDKAPMLSLLQRICDSSQFSIPGASLEEKTAGANQNPLFFVLTSNTPVYTFTSSVYVGCKMDRRTETVEGTFTELAKERATKLKVSIHRLLSVLTPEEISQVNAGQLKYTSFKVGYMKNEVDSLDMNLKPLVDVKEFFGVNNLIAYMMKQMRSNILRKPVTDGNLRFCMKNVVLPHDEIACGCVIPKYVCATDEPTEGAVVRDAIIEARVDVKPEAGFRNPKFGKPRTIQRPVNDERTIFIYNPTLDRDFPSAMSFSNYFDMSQPLRPILPTTNRDIQDTLVNDVLSDSRPYTLLPGFVHNLMYEITRDVEKNWAFVYLEPAFLNAIEQPLPEAFDTWVGWQGMLQAIMIYLDHCIVARTYCTEMDHLMFCKVKRPEDIAEMKCFLYFALLAKVKYAHFRVKQITNMNFVISIDMLRTRETRINNQTIKEKYFPGLPDWSDCTLYNVMNVFGPDIIFISSALFVTIKSVTFALNAVADRQEIVANRLVDAHNEREERFLAERMRMMRETPPSVLISDSDLQQQGNILNAVAPFPVENPPVIPVNSAAIPWMRVSTTGISGRLEIRREGKLINDLFYLLLTPNVIVFPAHLLHPDIYSNSNTRVQIDEIIMRHSCGDISMKFDEKRLFIPMPYQMTARDIAYYIIDPNTYCITDVFTKLPAVFTSPIGQALLGEDRVVNCKSEGLYSNPQTAKGDCGLPIFQNGVYYGFHVGIMIKSGEGIMTFLSKSELAVAEAHFRVKGFIVNRVNAKGNPTVNLLVTQGKLGPGFHPQSDAAWVDRKGEVKWKQQVVVGHFGFRNKQVMNGRSSEMFETFRQLKAFVPHSIVNPGHARLCPDGEWRSSFVDHYQELEKYPVIEMPNCLREAIKKKLKKFPIPNIKVGPLSIHQALVGDVRSVFVTPRDNSKSVGYTLSTFNVTKKNCFIQKEDESFEAHPEFVKQFAQFGACLDAGYVPPTFITASVKNEMIATSKVEGENKSRLFFIPDLVVNLYLKMFLGPIMSVLMSHPYISKAAGCLNPGSAQWKEMLQYLVKKNIVSQEDFDTINKFVDSYDGDQNKFDKRHPPPMWDAVQELFEGYARLIGYHERDVKKVGLLIQACRTSFLLIEGVIFLIAKGLGSGYFITFIFNCEINDLLFESFFYKLAEPMEVVKALKFLEDVDSNTSSMYCGDDSVMCIVKGFVENFGEQFLTHNLNMGYKLTDAHKRVLMLPSPIEEITFVKRSFRFSDGRVFAPLEMKSIVKALCYVCDVTALEERARSLNVISCMQNEVFLHGRAALDEFHSILETLPFYEPGMKESYDTMLEKFDSGVWKIWEAAIHPAGVQTELNHVGKILANQTEGTLNHCPIMMASGQKSCFLAEGNPVVTTSEESERALRVSTSFTEQTTITNPETTIETETRSLGVSETHEIKSSEFPFLSDPSQPEFSQILQRPRLLFETVNTTTPSNPSFPLLSVRLSPASKVLDSYRLQRMDFELLISWNGNKSNQGCGTIICVPESTSSDTFCQEDSTPDLILNSLSSGTLQPSSYLQLPHVIVRFSETGNVRIPLKYTSSRDFYHSSDRGWAVYYRPLTEFSNAFATTPDTFKVRVEYRVTHSHLASIIPQGRGELDADSLRFYSKYTSELSKRIPLPVKKLADLFLHGVETFAGYSRPLVAPMLGYVQSPYSFFSVLSGQPSLNVIPLGAHAQQLKLMDPEWQPLVQPDELKLKSLREKFDVVSISTLTNITQPTFTTNPATVMEIDYLGNKYISPPRLAFFTSLFERSRGSIRYKFDFYASPMIAATIGAVILPPGVAALTSFPTDGQFVTSLHLIAEETSFTIEVPWLNIEMYRENTDFVLANNASATYSRIQIFLLDIAAPSTSPPPLPYIASISAGSDFETSIVSLRTLSPFTILPQSRFPLLTGEIVENVKQLTSFYSKQGIYDFRGEGFLSRYVFPAAPMSYPNILESEHTNSMLTWVSLCYLGCTGGYQWGMQFQQALRSPFANVTTSFSVPTKALSSAVIMGRGAHPITINEDMMLEISIPDRDLNRYRTTLNLVTETQVATECWNMRLLVEDETSYEAALWVKGADDYQLQGFLMCPQLVRAL